MAGAGTVAWGQRGFKAAELTGGRRAAQRFGASITSRPPTGEMHVPAAQVLPRQYLSADAA